MRREPRECAREPQEFGRVAPEWAGREAGAEPPPPEPAKPLLSRTGKGVALRRRHTQALGPQGVEALKIVPFIIIPPSSLQLCFLFLLVIEGCSWTKMHLAKKAKCTIMQREAESR